VTTVAIVGAGPGLGAATARRFAAEGFEVALVSRRREHVDALAARLADDGVSARGYVADVRDADALESALTIVFVNGGSAVRPSSGVAGTSIAFAGEAALAQLLHHELAADGIHVAQLIVPGTIVTGHPRKDPAVLALRVWEMHTGRTGFRHFAEELDA
jgi:short-subunit dehydrogenase